jgi:hypothetical protein
MRRSMEHDQSPPFDEFQCEKNPDKSFEFVEQIMFHVKPNCNDKQYQRSLYQTLML